MGGQKKRHKEKDKKKNKKKDKEEKKKDKKDKYSSQSQSDDSSDSSDSSQSISKSKNKKQKSKQIKKSKEKQKQRQKQKQKQKQKKVKKQRQCVQKQTPQANIPYNFDNVMSAPFTSSIPGIKGISIPALPPPAPNIPNVASVPKPKSKEPNIFKLLPKLNYGPVLFAKTLYSTQFISHHIYDKLLLQMTLNIEKTSKEENHKKGISQIAKCINELEKIWSQEKIEKIKQQVKFEAQIIQKNKKNRYQLLQESYQRHLKNLEEKFKK